MERLKDIVKLGFGIAVAGALLTWAGALIYGIYTDPDNVWRYALKLMAIAGMFAWYFGSGDADDASEVVREDRR